ncbi:MAG: hypothetical protein IT566_06860 [Rhodospirillaceae bacterium]|nr:hypothetical protein [Rhodospirillaceae bacterium]
MVGFASGLPPAAAWALPRRAHSHKAKRVGGFPLISMRRDFAMQQSIPHIFFPIPLKICRFLERYA